MIKAVSGTLVSDTRHDMWRVFLPKVFISCLVLRIYVEFL